MYSITTIDDIVHPNYQDKIENLILNVGKFPWYYGVNTCDTYNISEVIIDDNTKDCGQFTHTFYSHGKVMSEYYPLVAEILPILEHRFTRDFKNSIIRIKANLILKDSTYPDGFYNTPHIDEYGDVVESVLYYVNDSDGDTVFFNEKPGVKSLTQFHKVSPKKGMVASFDSSYFHASTPPKVAKHRAVINFVFKR
jgi:hypothetical protein